ncbi:MAG TPA: acetate/propionate family kinase [Spirochaetota bacterium]|nr:acetate/propionate family kinase [Spirochaetota bacterium]HPC40344.1 acetate/propionate family kinase [Spirochaetota bacterium]HPL16109.1 acetate/propionate family kinase [Spirochaetota bacterium]HQF07181.1 acetate/propionate family kinase [Spirochaetota bacterium]HQH96080.1 acetate/propionate family kinase [Spirochaetota bacterium]
MNVLVINAGSSSLKFKLFGGDGADVVMAGHYIDIGETAGKAAGARIITRRGTVEKTELTVRDHRSAIGDVLGLLRGDNLLGGGAVIGHRIVHGGERYDRATLLTPEVLEYLDEISVLAPLHNPVALACVDELGAALPELPQYAVFDTAFHRTLPEAVYLYGLPLELYRKHGIRKYGFHGTNHKYVAHRAAEVMGRDIRSLKIVTCHLGNGQSICAVKHGKSVDTSMGFTPLEGLPMGTRSGSFDPEIIFFLMDRGYAPGEIRTLVNKRSGLLGLSGVDSHYKTIEDKARSGDAASKLASDILVNRIICTIGAYAAEMGGVDAVVFTGGIGENSAYLRGGVLEGLAHAGAVLDGAANSRHAETITAPGSPVRALVIPANEELQIAREVREAAGA